MALGKRRTAAGAKECRALPALVQRVSAPQAPRKALLPVERHEHIHFHGVSAADIAAILARREDP